MFAKKVFTQFVHAGFLLLSLSVRAEWQLVAFMGDLSPTPESAKTEGVLVLDNAQRSAAIFYFDAKGTLATVRYLAKDLDFNGEVKVSPDGKVALVPVKTTQGTVVRSFVLPNVRELGSVLSTEKGAFRGAVSIVWSTNCKFSVVETVNGEAISHDNRISEETRKMAGVECKSPNLPQAQGLVESGERKLLMMSDKSVVNAEWMGSNPAYDFVPAAFPHFYFRTIEVNSGEEAIFRGNFKTQKIQPVAAGESFAPDQAQSANVIILSNGKLVLHRGNSDGSFSEEKLPIKDVRQFWASLNKPGRILLRGSDGQLRVESLKPR